MEIEESSHGERDCIGSDPSIALCPNKIPATRTKPWQLGIRHACWENDVPSLRQNLQEAILEGHANDPRVLQTCLFAAISRGSIDATRYLVEEVRAPVNLVSPRTLAMSPSIPLFQVLVDHGWDINQQAPDQGNGPGECLLQEICHDDEMVRWCLDHGAEVRGIKSGILRHFCPPLLESVARCGSVETFKTLLSLGSDIGPRTLHEGTLNSPLHGKSGRGLDMVRSLIDEVGIDVNALDSEVEMPDFYGTPLCYVVKFTVGFEDTIRFLLEQGADPRIKSSWD